MRQNKLAILIFILASLFLFIGCSSPSSYEETFDEPGTWRTESDSEVKGEIQNGVYDFHVIADELTTWTTAGQNFSDGVYEVEATQVGGPNNNAFGMLFRVDDNNDNFYAFLISGDGYAWVGRYEDGLAGDTILRDWWIESPAIIKGNDVTNKLRVEAESGNMKFFINDQEIGRVTDNSFTSGDVGLMVRSLGRGDVHVQFDNFTVNPIP